MAVDHAALPRRHPAGRRLHHERPVRRRHAPARHLRVQAAVSSKANGSRSPAPCAITPTSAVASPGSNASDSTEIYAEGLRIAPLKLYEAGKLNKTIMTFIERNVRLPVKVFGDLRAQLAACHIAEKQFCRAGREVRPGSIKRYMRETDRLRRAPDARGAREAARRQVELRGLDRRRRRRLRQADPPFRARSARRATTWWSTGPAPHPQVKGAINNTLSFTKAASYTGVRSVLPQDIPNNEGVFRAIEVICAARHDGQRRACPRPARRAASPAFA